MAFGYFAASSFILGKDPRTEVLGSNSRTEELKKLFIGRALKGISAWALFKTKFIDIRGLLMIPVSPKNLELWMYPCKEYVQGYFPGWFSLTWNWIIILISVLVAVAL